MPFGPIKQLQRSAAFLALACIALCTLLVFASGCGTLDTNHSGDTASAAQSQSLRKVQVHVVPAPPISTSVRTSQRHLYPFSQSNVGLMQPTVDVRGYVWVGEMNANRLGRLNVHTGVVTSWTPPGAEDGIMTTIVDPQGNAWFTEQNANYIGRFDVKQQTFRIFPLGMWKGSPLGPQDLHFDSRGLLWFTAAEGGAIGRLDPKSGTIRLWSVPSSPSSLIVTPNGLIWFGVIGAIGSLDPASGQLTLYALPNPQAQVFSMAVDSGGRLWFTEVLPGTLAMFEPKTDSLTELPIPAPAGGPPALYALVIDHQEHIWFVDVGANMLVRYAPAKQALTFFQLSVPRSAPFGLTLDAAGKLWFTAGGSSANYIGEIAP
jgi:virginiamycin B lyase